MSKKQEATHRRRGAYGQADTAVITVIPEHVELIERIMETQYSVLISGCIRFRNAALMVFWAGLKAWRNGRRPDTEKVDPNHPAYAKRPKDLSLKPRKLTLTEEATTVIEFITETYWEYHPKEFQKHCESFMSLGFVAFTEMMECNKRRAIGENQPAEEEAPNPFARVEGPKKMILAFPAPRRTI